jgi:lipid A 3-O-deacylase
MKFFVKLAGVLVTALAISAGTVAAQELTDPSPERFERWGNYSDKMEVRLGVASYDTGLFGPMRFSGVNINGEFLFRSPEFLAFIGSPRPYIGFDAAITDDPDRPVNFAYAGLSWDYNITSKLYLSGSLGGAIHDASNLKNPVNYKGLGCRALFHLGAAVGYDITPNVTVQAYADHFSNANLCSENDGAESAGVRMGFRF